MTFAIGPFAQLDPANASVVSAGYDFTDMATEVSSGLTLTADGWDASLGTLALVAADPLTDLLDGTLDDILAALVVADTMADLSDLDPVFDAYTVADAQLTTAISFAPVQAWVDPPAPFVPPDTAIGLTTPTVPLGNFTPGVFTPGATPTDPNGPQVALLNTTRTGQTNFVVGDQFKVIFVGNPGQVVTVTATLNGVDLPEATLATIGADGTATITGTEGPDEVGAWFESYYFDGQLVQSFNFVVVAGNAVEP